jgi:hypothetical protein
VVQEPGDGKPKMQERKGEEEKGRRKRVGGREK